LNPVVSASQRERLRQFVGQPQFDERLSRYCPTAALSRPGTSPSNRKIHIHTLCVATYSPRLAQVEMIHHVFASVKLSIKSPGFQ
jgi:hypothetical protein